jgi:bile acid:Na+ symporter, BASS family
MKFTQKYFSLIILLGIGLAFLWPTPGFLIKPYIVYLLGMMMTLSCLKIELKELKSVKKEWWRYLVMLAIIFLLPTILTFLAHFVTLKDDGLYIGMMLAAAVPCGVSIVFISDLLGGQSSKALVTTTLAHLVSPIITPLIFWFFVHKIITVDFMAMIILILKLVIIPLILAEVIRKFKWKDKITKASSTINTYLLLILLWGIVAPVKNLILENIKLSLIAVVTALVIMLVADIVTRIFGRNDKEDITWMVAGTFKNFTLASVIALSLFGQMALLGSVIYGIVSNLIIVPLQLIYKKK